MTDQTNADIARHLREYAQQLRGSTHVRHTGADLIEQAAAALESLVQERDRLDEAFDRDLPWRYDEVEAQRNQLAAIVEQARLYCENQGDKFRYHAGRILDMLATAPADALREHDAKVRAEVLRGAAQALRMGLRGSACNEGCHKADRITLEMWADRIEKEAGL